MNPPWGPGSHGIGVRRIPSLGEGFESDWILDILGGDDAVLKTQLIALIEEGHPRQHGESRPQADGPGPTGVTPSEAGYRPVLIVAGNCPGESGG